MGVHSFTSPLLEIVGVCVGFVGFFKHATKEGHI